MSSPTIYGRIGHLRYLSAISFFRFFIAFAAWMSLGMVAFTRWLENHKIRNAPNFTFRCFGISFCCFSCRWQMYLKIGFFRIINCICSGVLAFLSVGWVSCSPIEGTRRSWPGSGFTQPVLSPFRGQENLVSECGYKWGKVLFLFQNPAGMFGYDMNLGKCEYIEVGLKTSDITVQK